jgi:hypothetical protein
VLLTAIVTALFLATQVSAGEGWQELPNTKLAQVCPPNNYHSIIAISDGKGYPFAFYCHNAFNAWSGGIEDTTGTRLIVFGGGHTDYAGNEIYSLNLGAKPVTLTKLNDPSGPEVYDRNAGPCPTTMPDGRPNTRHTNNSLAYIAHLHRIFMFSGGVACGNGFHYDDTWTLDVSNISNTGKSGWQAMDPTATACRNCFNLYVPPGNPAGTTHATDNWWSVAVYDPNTATVLLNLDDALFRYTYETNSYVKLQSNAHFPVAANGVIDPKRKLFIALGNEWALPPAAPVPHVIAVDVSGPPYTVSDWTSFVSTCGTVPSSFYPGLAYDPVIDRIVMWPGNGNTVYLFDPDTKTCTTQTFPNGPPPVPNMSGGGGVMGRFRYFPSLDAFVVMSDPDADAFLLRLSSTPRTAPPTTPKKAPAKEIPTSQINTAARDSAPPFSPTALPRAFNGLGHSTFTCLDKDGDGYGVGPGCLGPDADDNDATVQTTAQAIAKYGSMGAFLKHLGYNPKNIYYISAATNTPPGSDSNICRNIISTPCATFGHVRTLIRPGDMVMWRGAGTQAAPGYSETLFPVGGSSTTSPIIYMAYPGEKVWMRGTNLGQTTMNFNDVSYFVVDGLAATHGESGGCFGGGTSSATTATSTCHDVIFRNVETGGGCGDGGIDPQNGIQNWTIEDSVLHDNQETGCGSSCQHGIYIGSRQVINSNVVVQRVITYNNNWNGIHMNGRCQKCAVEQTVSYNNGISGLDFQNGFSNSLIRSNLAFNNGTQGITFFEYYGNSAAACNAPPVGSVPGCPFDETGNLIENNTVYNTGKNPQTGASRLAPAIVFNNRTFADQGVLTGDLGHNILRNNIFVSAGGNNNNPPIGFGDIYGDGACDAACKKWLATDIFDHNVILQNDGHSGHDVISAGPNHFSCATAGSATTMTNCMNSDPRFVSAARTYMNSVSSFNFQLQPSSPANQAGSATNLPYYDILGDVFMSLPSIGAYEASGPFTRSGPLH